MTLHLFFEEPDPDRRVPFDRYPRRLLRRLVRGPRQPGGHRRVFLNLCAGLSRLGVAYEVNNHALFKSSQPEIACVIGQPIALSRFDADVPIVFGSAVYSHPIDAPDLLKRYNLPAILVPCDWMRRMVAPAWGDRVKVWPVGIDTDTWSPSDRAKKDIDILIYDKILWNRDALVPGVLAPIIEHLDAKQLRTVVLSYGRYREQYFRHLVSRSRAMIYLCEHETQGIALQQALAASLPVFAWDRGGEWRDPSYFPDRVRFGPVTTVPYWDARCGATFGNIEAFRREFSDFWHTATQGAFAPRSYILEHFTLSRGAQRYLDIIQSVRTQLSESRLAARR